ncbi:MAG: hypothetical protein Q9219_003262 [cf. Caloplaca sp. 3 TL-2023]
MKTRPALRKRLNCTMGKMRYMKQSLRCVPNSSHAKVPEELKGVEVFEIFSNVKSVRNESIDMSPETMMNGFG